MVILSKFSSLDPRFDLQKKANPDTFPVETEASSLQSIPAFSKHFMNIVATSVTGRFGSW